MAAGFREAAASALGRAGPAQRLLRAALAGCLMRRRCGRIRRRCCVLSTTFILMRAAGRRSIRSRWTGPGAAGVRTRITTRWSRTVTSGPGCTGRGCRRGSRAASRTRSSTRSSPGCRRTGIARWWRSTCRPGRGPRSCCRSGAVAVDAGRQLITVVRKGTRELQELPASADAFVWLRLYQVEMDGADPCRPPAAVVVDAAPPVPAADLSRGAPHVRAGQ